jgi:hypothetical protein
VVVFWLVTLCGLVKGFQRFGGTYCLHLHGVRTQKITVDILPAVRTSVSKLMFMSRHESIGQKLYTKVANKSFENVVKLKYLEIAVTNENCIHEDIRSRLNSVNACYHALQNLSSY